MKLTVYSLYRLAISAFALLYDPTLSSMVLHTMNSKPSNISLLPREIFWMILSYLEHRDVIHCRRVSRHWNEAFRDPANLQFLLQEWFPLSKEPRGLAMHNHSEDPYGNYWRQKFDRAACIYDHLAHGKPKSVQKHRLCDDFGVSGEREWFPVQPWDSHASHLMQRVDCAFLETFWTYEDGLVVYPSADDRCLVLMDMESERKFMVPFIPTGKVVRRVRLQKRVLVVEWAEPKAFHWLNDSDGVHRHFASSYDVRKDLSSDGWSVVFRNEWKIMFLGHPLSERDRFFSTHSKTHYVIYTWQPNRSLYTADEDAPIESLMVWDISKPSSYRPSLDPAGCLRVHGDDAGPEIVTRFSFRELGFFAVRQRGVPAIQCLDITDDAQAVEITENICTGPIDRLVGPEEWASTVKFTSLPLVGDGPYLTRILRDVSLPPYRGNSDGLLSKPLVFPSNSSAWYLPISEAMDEQTHVAYRLHLSPSNWPFDLRASLSIAIPTHGVETTVKHDEVFELAGKGKICGDESYLIGENDNRELLVWRFDR